EPADERVRVAQSGRSAKCRLDPLHDPYARAPYSLVPTPEAEGVSLVCLVQCLPIKLFTLLHVVCGVHGIRLCCRSLSFFRFIAALNWFGWLFVEVQNYAVEV